MIYWLTDNVIITAAGADLRSSTINQVFTIRIFINDQKACYLYPNALLGI